MFFFCGAVAPKKSFLFGGQKSPRDGDFFGGKEEQKHSKKQASPVQTIRAK